MTARARTRGKTPAIATDMKLQPSQARAQETIELIVRITGELLEEVGFESLSTNLVCRRASITPPALYRYFPNKYALLRELGARLMQAQDDALIAWIDAGGLIAVDREETIEKSFQLQMSTNELTRSIPGNISILRAMRSTPALRDIRIASRDRVAGRLAEAMAPGFPGIPPQRLLIATRLMTELGTAATEMVLEEPRLDTTLVVREAARAMTACFDDLRAEAAKPTRRKPKR